MDMYNLRLLYPKSNPMNLIAKLLMNSLYGRFGMKPDRDECFFVDNNDLNELNLDIARIMELSNDLFFIESELEPDNKANINVAIASQITSYSRIHIFSLYYGL